MKKIFLFIFSLLLFQNVDAYTPVESCQMRTGMNGYIEINGTCVCAMPGYKSYGALDCRLDHSSCKTLYGPNGEMQKTGFCGCKIGTEMVKKSNGGYECKNASLECRIKFGEKSFYSSTFSTCQCFSGYKFSGTFKTSIGLNDSVLLSTKCVADTTINLNTNTDSVVNNSNTQKNNELDEVTKQYIKSAQYLGDKGFITKQKNDGDYQVLLGISRREILKLVMNMSGKNIGTDCLNIFRGMGLSDWGCKYSESALSHKIISSNNYFNPNQFVSKIEAIKMLFNAKGITVDNTGTNWQQGYINKGIEEGFFEKFTDFNTRATRGFIFEVAVKILESEDELNFDLGTLFDEPEVSDDGIDLNLEDLIQ